MAQRLSVVQLLPALEGGGVERGTVEVASELVRRGHRSLVVSAGGRLVERLERDGSHHITWPIGRKSPSVLRWVPRLARLFAEGGIDIVHARSRLPAWLAVLALRRLPPARRPHFVTTVHGLNSPNTYSRVMTYGERVIAVSEAARAYIQHHYPDVDPARITVIPRGVDPREHPYGHRPPEGWLADWRASHPALAGAYVLVVAGRVTRLKGHADLLALMPRLLRSASDYRVVIVGDDGRGSRHARRLSRAIADRGLDKHILWAGHRDDLREILAASHCLLSLSRRPESFGRTVLESLALGTPAVGYAHGGVGEILGRVYPAGAVPPGDVEALAQTVHRLRTEPVRVPDDQPLTLQRMLDDTLSLYTSVVSRPSCSKDSSA